MFGVRRVNITKIEKNYFFTHSDLRLKVMIFREQSPNA